MKIIVIFLENLVTKKLHHTEEWTGLLTDRILQITDRAMNLSAADWARNIGNLSSIVLSTGGYSVADHGPPCICPIYLYLG